ncbi:retention module-containing protein [Shewanella morhuae]|uniref:VCBS repeat n=1 Tax=Shewanella morhuae TaxID=365591 RepID=A0A380B1G5_9GAMM|nr:retention module-containing protein [Shewanella morhuae]SUI91498.1 VCBS repeat [Shewanella morhuae]
MGSVITSKKGLLKLVNGQIDIEVDGSKQPAKDGEQLPKGAVLNIGDNATYEITFDDGTKLSNEVEPNTTAAVAPTANNDAAFDEIQALQDLIASGEDPTKNLPETAAGNTPGRDGNSGYVTLARGGSEIIASSGYSTSGQSFAATVINTPEQTIATDSPSILNNDSNIVDEDTIASGNVLDNDSDVDSILSVVSFEINGTTYAAGTEVALESGSLVLNADGSYTFTPNENWNGQVPVITYTTNTGASATLTINITPIGDAPVIAGNDVGAVTEDASNPTLTDSGILTIDDADAGQSVFQAGNGVPSVGALGSLTIDASGNWTYDVANADVQYLGEGETKVETFVVLSADGTEHTVTITITGTNDMPVIAGNDVGAVTEDASNPTLTDSGILTIDDADAGQSVFQAGNGVPSVGALGSLTIDASGNWTYDVANADVQYLGEGETKVETFVVLSADGTEHTVTITITGTNDMPVIAGNDVGAVTEDASNPTLTDSGILTIDDADAGQSVFQAGNGVPSVGALGSLTIDASGNWTYDVANADVQYLGEGETKVETFVVLSADGTEHTVTITITGTNDMPVIAGNDVGAVTEDASNPTLTDSGILTIDDADAGQSVFQAGNGVPSVGALGSLTIDASGNWTYDVANADVQYLGEGETKVETFVVLSADGTEHTVTITITGTNDMPVIAGNDVGAVTEDASNPTLTDSGILTIDDADAGQSVFQAGNGMPSVGALGSLTIDASGNWTYDVANADVQYLGEGETKVETFVVLSADGTEHTVTITITGTNDMPVIAGNDVGAVTEDASNPTLTDSGILTIDDADAGQSVFQAGNGVPSVGALGSLTIDASGNWTYDVANADVQYLGEGETKVETFVVLSADGTEHTVTITIHGTDDVPTLVADTGSVTEDTAVTVDGNLTTSGTLEAGTGGDAGEDKFIADNFTGNYGSLTLDANGNWVYTADNSQAAIQALNVGESLTDTFTVLNADGVTSTTVTITINGTDDVPTLVADTGSVTEDTAVTVDGNLTTSGTLEAGTGGDAGEDKFIADNFTGNYGSLTLDANGNWVYTADNSQAAIQALNVGESLTDTFTVLNADGVTSTTVTITINGTDDVPTLVADTGSVTEDTAVTVDGNLTTSGTLEAGTGGDAGEDKFIADNFTGNYGSLTLDANGNWVYTADNSQAAIQALNVGESLTDTFTVLNADGVTSTTVTITINGTDDVPTLVADTGSVTEDTAVTVDGNLTTSGTLEAGTGGDAGEDKFIADNFTGNYGSLTLDANGNWVYTADNSQAAIQALNVGESLTDTFTVLNADGVTSTTVTITINGTDDVPTLVADTGSVTEDTAVTVDGNLTTSGTLEAGTGGDAGEDKFIADNFTGNYGSLTLDANGNWVYTADNSQAAIQALNVGESLTDTFTVLNADGVTSTTVTITINGTDDVPTLVADTGSVTEDTAVTVDGNLTTSGTLEAGTGGDAGEDKFIADNFTGNYGSLTLDANGNWVYTADNSQAAIQALNVGESLTDTFTVLNADGVTSTTVTITINGTDDVPTLVADTGSVTEDTAVTVDGNLTTSGTLEAGTGGDAGEDKFIADNFTGNYGSLTLDANGNWVYTADNSQAAIQALNVGESLTDTFTVLNADGVTSTTVTITINGTDDVPTLVADTGSVTEDTAVTVDGNLTTSGTLEAGTGGDAGEDKFIADNFTGNYGSLTLDANGNWVYTADNSQAAIQALNVGESLTDTFTVLNADGVTSTTVTITINGTDDVPTLVADTGSVTEDTAVTVDGNLTTSGTLEAGTGGDAGEDKFIADNFTGNYGSLTLDANGNWVYTADNSQAAIQALNVGESLTDTFTVLNADGVTSTTVTITINGTDDVPTLVADTGSVTEDTAVTVDGNLTTSGTLEAGTGGDAGEDKFIADNFTGNYGSLTLDANGNWVYTADNSQAAIQALNVGESLTDTFTVLNADGVTSTTVTITINGTDDVPTLVADTGSVTEDTAVTVDGNLTTSGTLEAGTGGDAGEDKFVADNFTGNYGSLTLDANGNWVYTADNSQAAIQALNVGESLTDTFTVLNADGVTSTTVTITINGTDDVPTLVADTGSVTEDTAVTVDGNLTTSGTLEAGTGGDAGEDKFIADNFTGNYGSLTLDANGNWVYTADNSQAAIQALNVGESLTDTFTVLNADGVTSTTVTITINGTNDVPVIGTTTSAIVSEEGLTPLGLPDTTGNTDTINSPTATGTINIQDVDGDSLTVSLSGPTGLLSGGQAVQWSWDPVTQILTGYIGTAGEASYTEIMTATLTPPVTGSSGDWTYEVTLKGPVDHPDTETEDTLSVNIGINVDDGHGEISAGSFDVTIEDDAPVISPIAAVQTTTTNIPDSLVGLFLLTGHNGSNNSLDFDGFTISAKGFTSSTNSNLIGAAIFGSESGIGVSSVGAPYHNLENEVDFRKFADDSSASEEIIITLDPGTIAYGVNIQFAKMFGSELEVGVVEFWRDGHLVATQTFSSDSQSGNYAANFEALQGGFDTMIIKATDNGQDKNSNDNSDFTVTSIEFLGTATPPAIAFASGTVSPDWGADGKGSLTLQGSNETNLFTATGSAITISQTANTLIGVDAAGHLVFKLEFTPGTGQWDFHQYQEMLQPSDGNIDFNVRATDGDGDHTDGTFSVIPQVYIDTTPPMAPTVQIVDDLNDNGLLTNDEINGDGVQIKVEVQNAELVLGGYVTLDINNAGVTETFQLMLTPSGELVNLDGSTPSTHFSYSNGTITWTETAPNSGQSITVNATQTDASNNTSGNANDTVTVYINNGVILNGLDIPGSEITVNEANLSSGSSPNSNALTQLGNFDFSTADGLDTVTIAGQSFNLVALLALSSSLVTIPTPYGELTLTGFSGDTSGGEISYSYTLNDNVDNNSSGTNTSYTDSIAVTVVDQDGSEALGNLDIKIIDDTPTANDDADSVDVLIDSFNFSGVLADWTDTTGGKNVKIFDGNDNDNGKDQVRWGKGDTQSGYGFKDNDANLNGALALNQDITLGTFTHYNYPIDSGSSITAATMQVTFNVTDAHGVVTPVTLTLNFSHNETPNDGADPRDIVTVGQTSATFNYEGQTYTMQVIGFKGENGEIVSSIYTKEDDKTSYDLVVRMVAGAGYTLPHCDGNVLTDDITGADAGLIVIGAAAGDYTNTGVTGNIGNSIIGLYGTLTLDANGNYHYQITANANDLPSGAVETFTYTMRDADGDKSSATLTINVNPINSDGVPVAGANQITSQGSTLNDDFVVIDGEHSTHQNQLDVNFGNNHSGEGNDTLIGGLGDDILRGDSGADTFVWRYGDADNSTDHITDFNVNEDKLDLSDLLQGETTNNLDSYLNFSLNSSGSTVIDIDGNKDGVFEQHIVLDGVDLYSTYNTTTETGIINGLLGSNGNGPLIIDNAPITPEVTPLTLHETKQNDGSIIP